MYQHMWCRAGSSYGNAARMVKATYCFTTTSLLASSPGGELSTASVPLGGPTVKGRGLEIEWREQEVISSLSHIH